MIEGKETAINFTNDTNGSLFTSDRGLAGRLKRVGLICYNETVGGWWFSLKDVELIVEVPKERGEGVKREVIS